MSSTGRGAVRRDGDFYATPAWVTRTIAPMVQGLTILDPACGDGAILDVFAGDRQTLGLELDHGRAILAANKGHGVVCCDALEATWSDATVVANPPFSLAEEFVRKALDEAGGIGHVWMLLRLSFMATKKRKALHDAHPCNVHVLPRRPSFTGGGTDSCDYAWFYWGPEADRRWSVLEAA